MRHAEPYSTTAAAPRPDKAPAASKPPEVPVAFGLNSRDDYEYVDVYGIPVDGSVLPVRMDEDAGPLVLKAEDPACLAEALEERLCVLTGDPDYDPYLWDWYEEWWEPVYGEEPPDLTLSGRAVRACTDVAGLCEATADLGSDSTALPQVAMYLDSRTFGRKRSTVANRLQSGYATVAFSLSEPEIVNHGGWPGEWAGAGAVLPDVETSVRTLVESAFDDVRPELPNGSSLGSDDQPPSLDEGRVKDAFAVLSRADLLLVPCTVVPRADVTFSASGMPSPDDLCPCSSDGSQDARTCISEDCPWETSYDFSMPVRPYSADTASEDFFPFLCWCMCPLWHHTAAWSCTCGYPTFPEDARHDEMESAGGTPTFYFSWAADEDVCCPTVAGINGSTGDLTVSVSDSVTGLPDETEVEDVVVVYRVWHVEGPEGVVRGMAKYVAKLFPASGSTAGSLTADVQGALTADVARTLLARSGMPKDPHPLKSLHSDQVGVDVVGAYAIVRPAFRSDLSEYRDLLD